MEENAGDEDSAEEVEFRLDGGGGLSVLLVIGMATKSTGEAMLRNGCVVDSGACVDESFEAYTL